MTFANEKVPNLGIFTNEKSEFLGFLSTKKANNIVFCQGI